MLLQFTGYLLIGRVLIFAGQKFPIQKVMFVGKSVREFLTELFDCDFCLGCYLYSGLAFVTGVNLLEELFGKKHRVFGSIITGIVSSFIMHIFRIGWATKFSITAVFQQPEE